MSRAVLRVDEEAQPALFDMHRWEQEVRAVRDQERFTGADVEKDARLVAAVLSAVSAGVPRRNICELARISSHTVQGIVERAEKDGRIAPFRTRIAAMVRRGAETIATSLIEDVEKGELPAASKPVALGILVDKSLLLDGEATARLEVRHVDPEGVWERIQRVRQSLEVGPATPPTESESDGTTEIAAHSCDSAATATAQATGNGLDGQAVDHEARPAPAGPEGGDQGGGGVAGAAGPRDVERVSQTGHKAKDA